MPFIALNDSEQRLTKRPTIPAASVSEAVAVLALYASLYGYCALTENVRLRIAPKPHFLAKNVSFRYRLTGRINPWLAHKYFKMYTMLLSGTV